MNNTWTELRKELDLTEEDERMIKVEKELINMMISIREEQGLSQSELARRAHVKQPMIARMEKAVHSPRIDSILRVLIPMGYTLRIAPLDEE